MQSNPKHASGTGSTARSCSPRSVSNDSIPFFMDYFQYQINIEPLTSLNSSPPMGDKVKELIYLPYLKDSGHWRGKEMECTQFHTHTTLPAYTRHSPLATSPISMRLRCKWRKMTSVTRSTSLSIAHLVVVVKP